MRYVRYNEPRDPELYKISKVIPDRWFDEHWPQRQFKGRGRWKQFPASRLIRVHLLVLLKRLGSFNRVCRALRYNLEFRRFCRLRSNDPAPTPRMLNEFREGVGLEGWREFHLCVLGCIRQIHALSPLGVVLVDASDLPAAIRRSAKKKTDRRWSNAESK